MDSTFELQNRTTTKFGEKHEQIGHLSFQCRLPRCDRKNSEKFVLLKIEYNCMYGCVQIRLDSTASFLWQLQFQPVKLQLFFLVLLCIDCSLFLKSLGSGTFSSIEETISGEVPQVT